MSIFLKEFQSYSELQGYCGGTASPGLYFVKVDETKDNLPTQYFYDGISLIESGSKPESTEIKLTNSSNLFAGNTVEQALNELFQNVDNGKSLLAAAVVDKGGTIDAANTFQEFANAIANLSGSGGGEYISIDYLNLVTNDTREISFTPSIKADQLAITTLILKPDQNNVEKIISNLDSNDISFDEFGEIIKESGKFKNKVDYTIPKTSISTLGELKILEYDISCKEFIMVL